MEERVSPTVSTDDEVLIDLSGISNGSDGEAITIDLSSEPEPDAAPSTRKEDVLDLSTDGGEKTKEAPKAEAKPAAPPPVAKKGDAPPKEEKPQKEKPPKEPKPKGPPVEERLGNVPGLKGIPAGRRKIAVVGIAAMLVVLTFLTVDFTNSAPKAVIDISDDNPELGQIVVLSAGKSTDEDGDDLKFKWEIEGTFKLLDGYSLKDKVVHGFWADLIDDTETFEVKLIVDDGTDTTVSKAEVDVDELVITLAPERLGDKAEYDFKGNMSIQGDPLYQIEVDVLGSIDVEKIYLKMTGTNELWIRKSEQIARDGFDVDHTTYERRSIQNMTIDEKASKVYTDTGDFPLAGEFSLAKDSYIFNDADASNLGESRLTVMHNASLKTEDNHPIVVRDGFQNPEYHLDARMTAFPDIRNNKAFHISHFNGGTLSPTSGTTINVNTASVDWTIEDVDNLQIGGENVSCFVVLVTPSSSSISSAALRFWVANGYSYPLKMTVDASGSTAEGHTWMTHASSTMTKYTAGLIEPPAHSNDFDVSERGNDHQDIGDWINQDHKVQRLGDGHGFKDIYEPHVMTDGGAIEQGRHDTSDHSADLDGFLNNNDDGGDLVASFVQFNETVDPSGTWEFYLVDPSGGTDDAFHVVIDDNEDDDDHYIDDEETFGEITDGGNLDNPLTGDILTFSGSADVFYYNESGVPEIAELFDSSGDFRFRKGSYGAVVNAPFVNAISYSNNGEPSPYAFVIADENFDFMASLDGDTGQLMYYLKNSGDGDLVVLMDALLG